MSLTRLFGIRSTLAVLLLSVAAGSTVAQLGEPFGSPLTPGGLEGLPGLTPPGTTTQPGPGATNLSDLNLTNPNTAEDAERMEKAKKVAELLQAEKYAEAEAMLKEELAKHPEDGGAWFFLGGTYRLENKLDEAIEAYGRSAQYMPENGDTFLRRGIAWFHKGEYGVAILDFEAAAGLNFGDPRPEFWKGLSLAKRNLIRPAIAAYTASIKTDREYVPSYVNRALAYMAAGDNLAAMIDLNNAIRLDPKNAELYYLRGIAYTKHQDYERADFSYQTALQLRPDYKEAAANREANRKYLENGKTYAPTESFFIRP